ncbi:STAS domain-containing protein [Lysobacter yangpyeongensis]|uniref:STAS domain-containing protein n=1 Tax=Lysobacter yangpyeongensis TaxID=346182 RepID=A0ABW0SQS8_9GAMM
MTATCTRQDDRLIFAGTLDRAAVATLWPQLQPAIAGTRHFDLTAVTRVDSAGLALLAELAALAGGVHVHGRPAGLDELRTAYRLQDDLSFAA